MRIILTCLMMAGLLYGNIAHAALLCCVPESPQDEQAATGGMPCHAAIPDMQPGMQDDPAEENAAQGVVCAKAGMCGSYMYTHSLLSVMQSYDYASVKLPLVHSVVPASAYPDMPLQPPRIIS